MVKYIASLVINEFVVSSSYNRSSHRMCSLKKAALKNFAIFTGQGLCWSLFLIKLQIMRPANFIKKRLKHMYFHINFGKFLRTPILKNTANGCFCYDVSRVLLYICQSYICNGFRNLCNHPVISLQNFRRDILWIKFGKNMKVTPLFKSYLRIHYFWKLSCWNVLGSSWNIHLTFSLEQATANLSY